MTRLQSLAANPRLALGALVTLLLAAGAVVGSGADFTASSAVKYSGTLAAMGTTALLTYNANVKHRYRFTVALDSSAGNVYQGDSATVAFDFNAA